MTDKTITLEMKTSEGRNVSVTLHREHARDLMYCLDAAFSQPTTVEPDNHVISLGHGGRPGGEG